MRMDHVALFVRDLKKTRDFYMKYFSATSNQRYYNPVSGLETYFLTFPEGDARLEIMARPDILSRAMNETDAGYIHFAVSVGSREEVDHLTSLLSEDGYTVCRLPRVTGDGYYESVVKDPEGNQIEIVG